MTADPLFEVDVPAVVEQTAAQRLRARQAASIAAGFHPLALGGRSLRLHPDAARPTASDGHGSDPYRCGSCVFRRLVGGHAKDYPKCLFGETSTPIPEGEQVRHGPKLRITTPRATRGAATDVKAWWPACVDWRPVESAQ